MRKMDCQEGKKPADRDHVEGMGGRGLGMTCETSGRRGEEMENICSFYLLRCRMQDHNKQTFPQAFSVCFIIYLSMPLSYCPYFPSPDVILHVEIGTQSNA